MVYTFLTQTILNAPLDSDFEPYLARIDEISQQADMISNVASELDEYTKALGKLFEGKNFGIHCLTGD